MRGKVYFLYNRFRLAKRAFALIPLDSEFYQKAVIMMKLCDESQCDKKSHMLKGRKRLIDISNTDERLQLKKIRKYTNKN